MVVPELAVQSNGGIVPFFTAILGWQKSWCRPALLITVSNDQNAMSEYVIDSAELGIRYAVGRVLQRNAYSQMQMQLVYMINRAPGGQPHVELLNRFRGLANKRQRKTAEVIGWITRNIA